jgi:hypothetical protein
MEVKKSHSLLYTCWRARKTGGKSQSKGLRTSGTNDINAGWSLKAQEPKTPISKSRRKWMSQFIPRGMNLLFLCLRPTTD